MSDFWKLILAFVFGGGGLALINIIQERWKMRYQRKVQIEDKEEAREDKLDEINKKLDAFYEKQHDYNEQAKKLFKDMEEKDSAQSEALKYVLLDRILYIGQSYIKHGEVTFDERKRLREMHDVYHNQLGGNGDAQHIMDAVDELPLRAEK